MAGDRGEVPNLPVSDLLDRYRTEVAKHKKGAKWECIRLEAMGRDRIASVRLRGLDAPHVSDWQKRRLEAVSAASVRRERNLLNHAFEIARKEWRWLTKNPFDGVRRPKDSKPRDRIATDKEIGLLTDGEAEMCRVVVFALETGMRASEIASNPVIRGKVAILGDSKTGDGRAVPLSAKAIAAYGDGFTLTAGSISTLFARRCKELEIEGLTFHDLRHTAATRLSKKLDVWELAKMFGWKDLKIPLNTYYKSDPEETAKKL